MISLATKCRPKDFDEVIGQDSIKKILIRQIETNTFKNCYLFNGASGCGKTTCARILANKINKGVGSPIEIDAASNNGVDNIREIVRTANERSLDSEYKIFIIDECHALTSQSWQAFLKCIEEPPKYTIFIFCTTEKNKVPDTIKNRCQVFNFNRISSKEIELRLLKICKEENFINYEEACNYISKVSNGQVRDAIANLEKCSSYSNDLSINNVIDALGDYSYDKMFSLISAILDGNSQSIYTLIEDTYNEGTDLKLFVDKLLEFCLSLSKYCIFNDLSVTVIPDSMQREADSCTKFDNASKCYLYFIDKLLELKNMLKTDTNCLPTIEVVLNKMSNEYFLPR